MPNLNDAPREVAQSLSNTSAQSSVRRTHPMLIVAAGAITLFCGVGVGVMTGIIPSAYSNSPTLSVARPDIPAATAAPAALSTSTALPTAVVPYASAGINLNPVENKAVGQPLAKSTPALNTASHHSIVNKSASTRLSGDLPGSAAEQAPSSGASHHYPSPVYAQNNAPGFEVPAPRAVEPVVCQSCGTVSSVNAIVKQGEGSGAGAVLGGLLGGLIGHQAGKGHGKDVATVAGAVGGALLGNTVEKNAKTANTYEVLVRMDDNTFQTVRYEVMPGVRVGDKVHLENGRILRD